MRLGIVSDCVHFKHPDGRVGTETHILLKQFEALAIYFDKVTICCPFVDYNDSVVASYYNLNHIEFVPVPNVGGDSASAKLKIITAIPKWFNAFRKVDKISDIVYQRFPNNLNIPGFFFFYFKKKKVFATYTSAWDDYESEPSTYRFQKKILTSFFRGPVWAYLEKNSSNPRIHKGFSPSYHQAVWDEETEQVNERIKKMQSSSLQKLKLISVGGFRKIKNHQTILDACLLLKQRNIPFNLTLIGGGVLRQSYEDFIQQNNLKAEIQIAGKKTSEELRELFRKHDFVVQAPLSEGFGKVPIEGYFHGLIPILNDVDLARFMTLDGKGGFTFDGRNSIALANLLSDIYQNKFSLGNMISAGREFVKNQTLEAWAKEYVNEIQIFYEHI